MKEKDVPHRSMSNSYWSKVFILAIKGLKYEFFLKMEKENNANSQDYIVSL